MLDPHDRRHLFEALAPPPGFQLDQAIGTTFSLDLMTLLTVPLAFIWGDGDVQDPLLLLQGLQAYAERMTLYCQAGRIAVPPDHQLLFSQLEGRIVQVTARVDGGVFHPKLWVLRYICPTDEGAPDVRYRLLVSSRNLTFDRSWDTLLCLDGVLRSDRQRGYSINDPLSAMIAALPTLAVAPVPPALEAATLRIADEVRRVVFETPPDFRDLRFHALGLNRRRNWPFGEQHAGQALVIAPFITPSLLARLAALSDKTILISRLAELQKAGVDALSAIDQLYVLDEAASVEMDEHEQPEALTGLHAKLFVIERSWNATIWTGSANATEAAFFNNVEFLVELTGRRARVGIDQMLQADEQGGLINLLQPFEPQKPVEDDPLDQRLEQMLDRAQVNVACQRWHAAIEERDASQFDLTLSCEALDLPSGMTLEIRPISLGEGYNQLWHGLSARWSSISFAALTAFFVVALHATLEGKTEVRQFVLHVPTTGMPADRNARLLQHMLSDRNVVLRYLQLLLAEADEAPSVWGIGIAGSGEQGASAGQMWGNELFELLLRTLAERPHKLPAIQRVIDSLNDTPDRLPPDLLAIWQPVWQAYSMLYGPDEDGKV